MQNKIISFQNKPKSTSLIKIFTNWLHSSNSETAVVSLNKRDEEAIIYLKDLFGSHKLNILNLKNASKSYIFRRNHKQLEFYFSGNMSLLFNAFDSDVKNNYFQKKLEVLLTTLFDYGICDSKELTPLTRRNNTKLIENPQITHNQTNWWKRTRESFGEKDNLHIIKLTATLTEKGMRLVAEAIKT